MIKTVNFGDGYSGLTTVGYTLINSDGSTYQSRTTSGVFEVQIDSGIYGVEINFDDPVNLIILWDDGQDEPLYASEEIYIDNSDTTSILDIVTDIDNKSDIIINTTNEINNKVDEILIDSTNMDIKLDIIDSKCTEISNDLKRVLGLVHENIFIDLPSYDDNSNLISARLRIYSSPSSVGTNNNILATYIIESDSSGPGKFTNWKQVRS
jgi:hypothetical protein